MEIVKRVEALLHYLNECSYYQIGEIFACGIKYGRTKKSNFLKTQRNKCIYNQIFHHVMFSSATSLLLAQNFKQLKVLCTFVQILKYIKKKNLEAKKAFVSCSMHTNMF